MTVTLGPSNYDLLPTYSDPRCFLPAVQETVVLFKDPPYLFSDFVGRALSFLKSRAALDMGFVFDAETVLPCKWKCSDESLFGVDLTLFAFTGHFPFDKGLIGGRFNESSVQAAVHHSPLNIDFGGAHVGYVPREHGGTFGVIERPLHAAERSADCGYLMALIAPFKEVYDDACRNIQLSSPDGVQVLVSIPNEYLHPSWSSRAVKLLVDLPRLTASVVPYDVGRSYTHKVAGRTLFVAAPAFLEALPPGRLAAFRTAEKVPIGEELTADCFNLFDTGAPLSNGFPTEGILPYMKFILSSKLAPFPIKAAVTSSNIEHNKLTDTVREEIFRPYTFASFTGVFIDLYDRELGTYVNLFQPIGLAVKAPGRSRETEISPAETRAIIDAHAPCAPLLEIAAVPGFDQVERIRAKFSFSPSGG
jgi:hypothetical protein